MMVKIAPAMRRTCRTALFLALAALLLAACGLMMDAEARLDRAEQAYEDGEYRAAIIDAKNVLLDDPNNVRARLLLGRSSVKVGDGAAAEKELRRAIELGTSLGDVVVDLGAALLQQNLFEQLLTEITTDDVSSVADRVAVLIARGDAYRGVGQFETARESYTAVLDIDSEKIEAKLGIVSTYAAERNFVQARGSLDEVLTRHPNSVKAWLASGGMNLQLRSFENAEGNFTRALTLLGEQRNQASEAVALAGLAGALLALEKTDEARGVVAQLVTLMPESTSTLQLVARLAYIDEDWRTAEGNLLRVLQRFPDFRPAQSLLGAVHLRSGNLAQAEMYLSSVVAAMPGNIEARTLLAETRLQMDHLDEARETLLPLISGGTTNPVALAVAARVGISSGDFESSIVYLQRSLEANPFSVELQFQLAAAFISAGRIDQARETLDALEVDSSDDDGYRHGLLSVMAQFSDGDAEAALIEADELAKRWPDNAEVHNLIGYIHLAGKDFDSARENFETGAELSQGNLVAKRYLATIDVAEGLFESAANRYREIVEAQPNAIWAMISLARIAAQSEDSDTARKWLERARATDSKTVMARAMLAGLYASQRNYAESEKVAAEAVALDSGSAGLRNVLGLALLKQSKFDAAVTSFGRALDLDAKNPEYRLNLAKAQKGLDDASAAKRTLEQSQDLGMSHIPSAGMLISLRIEEGDIAGAMQLAKRLQERHPDNPVPIAYEAEVQVAAGDLDAAIESYARALALRATRNLALRAFQINERLDADDKYRPLLTYLARRPLDTTVRMVLAQAYQRNDRMEAAESEYQRVIESDSDNAAAMNNLAWIHFLRSDSRAEETARRAYELQPDTASVADTLGWILVDKGATTDGVKFLREAVESGGGRAVHRYHLAAGLAKLGQKEEARGILEDVLRGEQGFTGREEAEELLLSL